MAAMTDELTVEAAGTPVARPVQRAAGMTRTLGPVLLFVIILAVGAYFRMVGLDWDEGAHLHPDERFLSLVESAIQPVGSVGEYFDTARSTLNPNNQGYGFFVYGDLPIILVRYVGEWLGMNIYYDIYLVWRTLSAVSDLLDIVLIKLVELRLYDGRVALLTAALSAAAALPIQLSHFFTVDTYTNVFVVAAFLFAARALDHHRWLDYVLFGLMLGLAMASKVSVFPLALILILALGLRVIGQLGVLQADPQAKAVEANKSRFSARCAILAAVAGLMLAGLVTVVAFRIAQPYAFLPPRSGGSPPSHGACRYPSQSSMGQAAAAGVPLGQHGACWAGVALWLILLAGLGLGAMGDRAGASRGAASCVASHLDRAFLWLAGDWLG